MEKDPSGLPGMRRNPWILKTADGKTEFSAFRDALLDPPAIVVLAGKQELRYHLRCLDDLYEMLKERADWVPLGWAAEAEQPRAGSVEAWARSPRNPLGGWYGLQKGSRGLFALFIPVIMRVLNLAEVEDGPGGGRMRAV
ncbi:MAG: DUF6855 family protein [Spirochaetia bacterium]|jgi:hypothetical protein